MLSPDDARLAAGDAALPGLHLLLDEAALLHRLRQTDRFAQACAVQVQYLRYKPGNSATAGLRVQWDDGRVWHGCAKVLTATRFVQSWTHPQRQKLVQAGHPRAPLGLADAGMMVFDMAHDRAIRHWLWLDDGAAGRQREALLRQWLAFVPADQPLQMQVLRYKPERRVVVRVDAAGQPVAVLRCANASEFGEMLNGVSMGVALGQLVWLGVSAEHRLLATRWQPGHSLCPEEGQGLPLELMPALGQALARVHRTDVVHPLRRTAHDEVRALWSVHDTLQAIATPQAQQFHALATRVAQALLAEQGDSTLIHGDFSADQVIRPLAAEGLQIIDWDRAAQGHPLTDLASLQARFELQVIEGVMAPAQCEQAMQQVLAGYQQPVPRSRQPLPDVQPLRWHVAAALLRLATEPFRKRSAQWLRDTDAVLQRVQQLLDAPAATIAPATAEADTLTTLTDVAQMAAPLRQALDWPQGTRLDAARLLRHKPGRRAVVEYRMQRPDAPQPDVILGKYRHKGADRTSFAVQQALWNQGFDEQADVSVPEPLGIWPEHRLWLQRRVAGADVMHLLRSDTPQAQLLLCGQRVAQALLALHGSGVADVPTPPRHWTLADEMAVLRRRLTEAAALRPHWADAMTQVLVQCEQLQALFDAPQRKQPRASLHRDFYPDQVLLREGQPWRVVLLDLDLVCWGHPALDAGNYLAHVQELGLRLHGTPEHYQQHARAFAHTFVTGSEGVTAQDVAAFTVLSLARHIYLSTQFADRQHTTPALIDLCIQQLALCLS